MMAHDHTLTRRRSATVAPSTFDAEARTFEAVISTGADVPRRDKSGYYVERLDLNAVDPGSLVGLPVQLDHDQSARNAVGKVIAARRAPEGLVATIQLTAAADATWVRERIGDGTLDSVSIAYSVQQWAETKEKGRRIRTARIWSIIEVSIVAIPADPGAKTRTAIMEEEVLELSSEQVEANRRKAIRTIGRAAYQSAEWADDLIGAGATETEARSAAFEAMQARPRQRIQVRVGQDHADPAAIRTRREEALYSRVSGTAPTDAAREFVNDSPRDHARAILEAAGLSTRGMTADEIFTRAHGTTDFPELLTGVGRRVLMSTYTAAASPLKRLARSTTLADFRPKTVLKLGEIGALQRLSEHGEIRHTTRSEAKEGYALDTYASMFSLTRKALVNDDLGAFSDWGREAGRAAAETEANVLFSLLATNSGNGPKMGEDNKNLFHADHGNLATGADIMQIGDPGDGGPLTDARVAMRRQKGLDGKTPINVTPKFLLVRPEDETDAEKLLAAVYPPHTSDVNVFTGKLEILVEPRLTGKAWYLFADPAANPVFEYAYLSGASGPQIASQAGWNTLGVDFRVYLDFGAGAVDFRGAYRNPGE